MASQMTTARTRGLLVRTVLDLRPATAKYLGQCLLLAASWHRNARADSDFEVLQIGGGNTGLERFLDDLGARHARITPGANDDFSAYGNKIEGSRPGPAGGRVLLLDNDTCILGGLSQLADLPAGAIAAAEAGHVRVSDAQWQRVGEDLGLAILRREWAPLNPRVNPAPADAPLLRERWLYLNSGVILFPAGYDGRGAWAALQRAIHDGFAGHALADDAVSGSDQAGFAASVAAHGEFAWLPARFNYRPPCFCLGLEPVDRIGILHFTADIDPAGLSGAGERIDAYWRQRIFPRIDRLPASVTTADRDWRRAQAADALQRVQELARAYELDRWLDEAQRSRVAATTTTTT